MLECDGQTDRQADGRICHSIYSACKASFAVHCKTTVYMQEDQNGCVSLCVHQMASFTSDHVTQPSQSLSLQRRSPYAVQSQLGLLFIGMSTPHVYCWLQKCYSLVFVTNINLFQVSLPNNVLGCGLGLIVLLPSIG